MDHVPRTRLQDLPVECHQIIVTALSTEASPATAFVPSIRAWSATSTGFRKIISETGWLSAENVCQYKFNRALEFSCPALRVLAVATHHADVLTAEMFRGALARLPEGMNRPDDQTLALMLVNRAGGRLKPEVTQAYPRYLPAPLTASSVADSNKVWEFGELDFADLMRFIDETLGPRGATSAHVESRAYYFVDDCFAILQTLPIGLRTMAFMMLAQRIPGLVFSKFEAARDTAFDLLFDIDSLMPVRWSPILTKMYFAGEDFTDYVWLLLRLRGVSPATVAGICCRVVQLVGSFVDGLPDCEGGSKLSVLGPGKRHWKRLMQGHEWNEANAIKRLLNLLSQFLADKRVRQAYTDALVGRGFITRAERPFGSDRLGRQKDFHRWFTHFGGRRDSESSSELNYSDFGEETVSDGTSLALDSNTPDGSDTERT